MERLTNKQLAETDEAFRTACAAVGQFPSRNRYRRFKHKRGLAYLTANHAVDNARAKVIKA